MSENTTEKRHTTVLLVVELDMMEDFPWAEVIRAATKACPERAHMDLR